LVELPTYIDVRLFALPPVILTLLAFWVDIVPKLSIEFLTNAVVAICVVFVPLAALGAVGVPDKAGLALNTTLPVPVDVVTPVPPLATAIVVAFHVPAVNVPTPVMPV
jgi:hypothetical protein